MTFFPPRSLDPAQFGRIDYLYSSHFHLDHSHPPTLERLRPSVGEVLLPGERPDLLERFRSLGYERIRLLDNGVTVALPGGLEVTSWWSDAVDSCLVARMDGQSAAPQRLPARSRHFTAAGRASRDRRRLGALHLRSGVVSVFAAVSRRGASTART
jgi:hypothetical protein